MPLSHLLRDGAIWITTQDDVEYKGGLDELAAALKHARESDPRCAWDIVFDIRNSREQRSSGEIQGIASYVAENRGALSGRCVVIANGDFYYGLARMFQAYCESLGLEAHVAREVEPALAWLRGGGSQVSGPPL